MRDVIHMASATPLESVTIVVVAYDSAAWLPRALSALGPGGGREGGRAPFRTLVVDNASTDGSADLIATRFPDVRLIRNARNLGFAGAANVGIRAAESELVVLLNPDVRAEPGAIDALARSLAADPGAAIAGGKLLYPDGETIQHAGGRITYPLAFTDHHGYAEADRGQHEAPRDVDYVTGAFFAVRRPALDHLGLFDEGFFPAYFEETDLCYRARRAGLAVRYVPTARAIHHESATTGKDTRRYFHLYHRNRLRFVLKHWTEDQLVEDFLSAEIERMRGLPGEEVAALAEAYADNLAVLQGRAAFFANPSMVAPLSATPVRLQLLRGLAERAIARGDARAGMPASGGTDLADRSGPGGRDPGHPTQIQENPPMSETPAAPVPSSTPDTLSRLRARQRIVEPEFSSTLPALGPALVRLRRAWNWMSTKWYVRPIVQQQTAFNEVMVDAVADLHHLQAAARDHLGALERKLETWEGTAVETERSAVGLTREVALLALRLQRIEARLASIEQALGSSASAASPPPLRAAPGDDPARSHPHPDPLPTGEGRSGERPAGEGRTGEQPVGEERAGERLEGEAGSGERRGADR